MTFTCKSCGKEHDGLPELGYQRPDVVWALDVVARTRRVDGGNDLCVLRDEAPGGAPRFFIRGTIPLPAPEIDDDWAVGVWAEIAEPDYQRCVELYDHDACGEPRFPGTVANAPKGFEDALGARVLVQLGTETQRPTFWFPLGAGCSLAKLQRSGITLERIHDVIGHFD